MAVTEKERIAQLEKQIETLRATQSRYVMKMGDEIERRTKLLRQQLDKEYSRTYDDAMKKTMEKLRAQSSSEADLQRKELNRLRAEIDELEKECEKARAALRESEKRQRYEEQTQKAETIKALGQLDDGIRQADDLPCEEFFPKKLPIYTNAREEGKRLMGRGLLSQAFSVLSSAALGIKRLIVDSNNKNDLFMHYTEEFRAALEEIRTTLKSEAAHSVEYDGELLTLTDDELAYWSDWMTEQLYSELEKYESLLRSIDSRGVKAVKELTDDPIEFIRKKIEGLVTFSSKLQVALEYAFSAYLEYLRFAESNYDRAVSAMRTQGFTMNGCKYGSAQTKMPGSFIKMMSAEECLEKGGRADLRETKAICFRRELTGGGAESAVLSFVPVRCGTQVHSDVTMSVTTDQAREPLYNALSDTLLSVGIDAGQASDASGASARRCCLNYNELCRIASERVPAVVGSG